MDKGGSVPHRGHRTCKGHQGGECLRTWRRPGVGQTMGQWLPRSLEGRQGPVSQAGCPLADIGVYLRAPCRLVSR